jgi:hypothetical protein
MCSKIGCPYLSRGDDVESFLLLLCFQSYKSVNQYRVRYSFHRLRRLVTQSSECVRLPTEKSGGWSTTCLLLWDCSVCASYFKAKDKMCWQCKSSNSSSDQTGLPGNIQLGEPSVPDKLFISSLLVLLRYEPLGV